MRKQDEWLTDILEGIEHIEKYALGGEEEFIQNELIQIWMIHHLQLIGEAANKLDAGITKRYSEIPWDKIVGLRNIIVHEYFGVDLEEIWNTVAKDIPELKKNIQKIVSSIDGK